MRRSISLFMLTLSLIAVAAAQPATTQKGPDRDAFSPAQAAADLVLAGSGSQIAFLPAGMMTKNFRGNDLIKLFRFPGDNIVVTKLTGKQIRLALEKSASLYPSPNSGFLQIAGITVNFDPSKPANKRIVSAKVGTRVLNDSSTYNVAMPISLARGGYGYFSIWDKKAISRNLDGVTLSTLLKGKRPTNTPARWKSVL